MSGERDDCEHKHGEEVFRLAKTIGAAHDMEVKSAILVLVGPEGTLPAVIGKYNTTALAVAADAVLIEGAKHEPDGCVMCDAAGQACDLAGHVLRDQFRMAQEGPGEKRSLQ